VGTTTSAAGQSSTAQTSPPSRGSPRPSRIPSLSVRKRLLSGSEDTTNRAVPSSSETKYRKSQTSPPSRGSPRPSRIPIRYKHYELQSFGWNVASGRLKRSPTYSETVFTQEFKFGCLLFFHCTEHKFATDFEQRCWLYKQCHITCLYFTYYYI